jgi:hypothetical protein
MRLFIFSGSYLFNKHQAQNKMSDTEKVHRDADKAA